MQVDKEMKMMKQFIALVSLSLDITPLNVILSLHYLVFLSIIFTGAVICPRESDRLSKNVHPLSINFTIARTLHINCICSPPFISLLTTK